MSLLSAIKLALSGEYASALDIGDLKQTVSYTPTVNLADGTGANQANKIWTDQRTLAASATENLDLNGVLTDAFGAVLNFTKIKALLVRAAAANVNDVLIGGHASAAVVGLFGDATDVLRVKPGGFALLVAPDATGYPVVATTGDMLKVANSAAGSSVVYDIIVIGV
jgi:hypothetical protein